MDVQSGAVERLLNKIIRDIEETQGKKSVADWEYNLLEKLKVHTSKVRLTHKELYMVRMDYITLDSGPDY